MSFIMKLANIDIDQKFVFSMFYVVFCRFRIWGVVQVSMATIVKVRDFKSKI